MENEKSLKVRILEMIAKNKALSKKKIKAALVAYNSRSVERALLSLRESKLVSFKSVEPQSQKASLPISPDLTDLGKEALKLATAKKIPLFSAVKELNKKSEEAA